MESRHPSAERRVLKRTKAAPKQLFSYSDQIVVLDCPPQILRSTHLRLLPRSLTALTLGTPTDSLVGIAAILLPAMILLSSASRPLD